MVKNKKISNLTRELIYSNHILFEALQRDIANYSAIAREIRPMLIKELGSGVNISSVVSAIKREVKQLSKIAIEKNKKIKKVVARSNISVKTNVCTLTLKKNIHVLNSIKKIFDNFTGKFLHIFEGVNSVTLVMSEEIYGKIKNWFSSNEILENKKNLAGIIVSSPQDIVGTPGIVAFFYNLLSAYEINIEEEMSSYTDTIIIVKDKDVNKAFSAINSAIQEARK